jgi:TonB family protein
VRDKWIRKALPQSGKKLLAIIFTVVAATAGVRAQSSDAGDVKTRLTRARALAAAHNLAAAANELDTIRKTTSDDSVRDVARLMLMGICLEEGNYMRAQMLLEEIYGARSSQSVGTTEAYFALAGQALNGAREHIERYRSFGINVADKDLPTDAINDLDRLRALLERIAEQARQMSAEEARASASAALLEDVSSLRASLARSNQERQQWQREMASARQKLSAEEARMTPVSGTINSPRTIPASNSTDNNNSTSRNETQNNPTAQNNSPARVGNSSAPAKAAASTTTENSAEKRSAQQPPQPVAATNAGADSNGSAKPQDGKPVNVGSLIEKATQKINPSYPQTAKSARITGIVTVFVEVDPTGVVSTVQSTSGPAMLRQAAMDAARRWKFRPTMVDGQPVRVVGFINFNFTL